ncbi:MAG: AAA family ATPase [Candidatus Eremiobacterota bacterium]
MTTGLIMARFLPPHLGHCCLLDFARQACDRVLICLLEEPGDLPAWPVRKAWVEELCPACEVVANPDGVRADLLFGRRACELALPGALRFPLEPLSIPSAEVRRDPLAWWHALPPCVRGHYARRVAIVGPESCGKTTLARDLARRFETLWVPEFARGFLDGLARGEEICRPEDIPRIAQGQRASEEAMARHCNRLLFCDTDLTTTALWSRYFFGDCPADVERAARECKYWLTLLCAPDVPWVEDPQRVGQSCRQPFLEALRDRLAGRRVVELRGSWQERLNTAVRAVETL